jgi:hypothetical protein
VGLRTVVFIDYQNVYHRARAVWGAHDNAGNCIEPPFFGNVKPLRLGVLLKQLGENEKHPRTLTQVRIYRGEPTVKSHPMVQGAFQRQKDSWDRVGPVLKVITRPLRYQATAWDHYGKPIAWDTGREKGIDVEIALDLAIGAMQGAYDIAILVSGDTDLIPAIHVAQSVHKKVENAVWWPSNQDARPLRAKGLWIHRLTRDVFDKVRDDTDYGAEWAASTDL